MSTVENKGALSASEKTGGTIVQNRGSSGSFLRSIIALRQTPLSRPRVNDGFGQMSTLHRTLESLQYSLFLLEYRIAPNGWLRTWTMLWGRLFLLIAIPVIASVLVVQIAVPLFAGMAEVATHAEQAMRSGFRAMCWLVLSAMLLAALVVGGRSFIRRRQEPRHRSKRRGKA